MGRCILVSVMLLESIAAAACGAGAANSPTTLRNQHCEVPLWRTDHIIRAILDNLVAGDAAIGGIGIARIERTAPETYAVFLPQEERTDVVTYVVDIDETCTVKILKRIESTLDAEDPGIEEPHRSNRSPVNGPAD